MRKRLAIARSRQLFLELYGGQAGNSICVFVCLCIFMTNVLQIPHTPPTYINVERLFSYAGMISVDKRGSLAPERLDNILFLRENVVMLAFNLEF